MQLGDIFEEAGVLLQQKQTAATVLINQFVNDESYSTVLDSVMEDMLLQELLLERGDLARKRNGNLGWSMGQG